MHPRAVLDELAKLTSRLKNTIVRMRLRNVREEAVDVSRGGLCCFGAYAKRDVMVCRKKQIVLET